MKKVANDINLKNYNSSASLIEVPVSIETLFIEGQYEILRNNFQDGRNHKNHYPISFIRVPSYNYKILLTEIHKDKPELGFGLIEYEGLIKITNIDLRKITELEKEEENILRPDFRFTPNFPLAVYAFVANHIGTIVTENNENNFKTEFLRFATPENLDNEKDIAFLKKDLIFMF